MRARSAIVFVIVFAGYLLLVDQLVGPELLAGAATALLVTLHDARLARHTERRYRPVVSRRLRPLALPREILRDGVRLLACALRARVPEGATRTIAFDSETGLRPERDAARRALVVARLSVAPNSFVVLRTREPGRLLLHDLLPADDPGGRDPQWPS